MQVVQVDREADRVLKRCMRRNHDKLKYIVTSLVFDPLDNVICINVTGRARTGPDVYITGGNFPGPSDWPKNGPPISFLVWSMLGVMSAKFGLKLKI